MNVKVTMLDIL